MQTEEELSAPREEIERAVRTLQPADDDADAQALIAANPHLIASAAMAPLHFSNTRVKQKIATTDSDPLGAATKPSQWNLLVTGNAGSGKFSFTQMFGQYLRTHGI